jgi:two-component system, NtrC family, sensor kinase
MKIRIVDDRQVARLAKDEDLSGRAATRPYGSRSPSIIRTFSKQCSGMHSCRMPCACPIGIKPDEMSKMSASQSQRAKNPTDVYNAVVPSKDWTCLGGSMADTDDRKQSDPTQWALRERVKELLCLYGIAKVVEGPPRPLQEVACGIVALLPPSWQHPEVSTARITLDGQSYCSEPFAEGLDRQSADIVVSGQRRGTVEVFYLQEMPLFDEGPFLKEERSLINEVARQIALVLERQQAETERAQLQEQLRNADRLATVGKLAAGVAHELNEPLGVILGYAQLTLREFGIPDQMGRNLEKIVKASLHAREVIRKLLLFSRQVPSERRPIQLNAVVKDSLYLLESRCIKSGVKIALRLGKDLPEVLADPGQIQQVVLNLGVNAIQAMSAGGTLKVITELAGDHVLLTVEDTGVGMGPATVSQIFNPFFTTKEVGQGTGLGLSVVHGIITAHGGTIQVDSAPGRGSRFNILLPSLTRAGGAPK